MGLILAISDYYKSLMIIATITGMLLSKNLILTMDLDFLQLVNGNFACPIPNPQGVSVPGLSFGIWDWTDSFMQNFVFSTRIIYTVWGFTTDCLCDACA